MGNLGGYCLTGPQLTACSMVCMLWVKSRLETQKRIWGRELYLCYLRRDCWMKEGELLLLWKLFPNGCAVWPAAPESPPTLSSGPVRPVRPSASAYCGSEPGRGSLYKPWSTFKQQVNKSVINPLINIMCFSVIDLWLTYIDHSIRGDSKQCRPLCNLSDLFPHVPSSTNPLQFWQRPV